MVKLTCDYCLLPIREGSPVVKNDHNDFHPDCWEWINRQRAIHSRKVATGATFQLLKGPAGDERCEA